MIIHANSTAPAEAPAAMFCGRLYMPPPIMELTTIAASAQMPKPEEGFAPAAGIAPCVFCLFFNIFRPLKLFGLSGFGMFKVQKAQTS